MYPWNWFRVNFDIDIGPIGKHKEDFCFAYIILGIGAIAMMIVSILILFPDFFEIILDPMTYVYIYEMLKEDFLALLEKMR